MRVIHNSSCEETVQSARDTLHVGGDCCINKTAKYGTTTTTSIAAAVKTYVLNIFHYGVCEKDGCIFIHATS